MMATIEPISSITNGSTKNNITLKSYTNGINNNSNKQLNCCTNPNSSHKFSGKPTTSCSSKPKLRNIFLVSYNERIYSRARQAHCGVEQERERHLKSFPAIIHPYSNFRWYWEIFMSILLIIVLISQPLQITFYPGSMSSLKNVIIDSCISIVFILDILLNFRTGFIQAETDVIMLDSSIVALKYFKTWFVIDLISSIPFDLIYYLSRDFENDAGQLAYFRFFRLFELLKILRLARVVRYLRKIEHAYKIKRIYSRVINLIIMMACLIHWLGCLHYLVADLVNINPSHRNTIGWVTEMDLWDAPVFTKYVHGLLRAVSNMGCMGYGFSTPRSVEDALVTIFCMIVGATCFALFIANVSNIVLNLETSHDKYMESLNQTIEYMNFKGVPKSLQHSVISYYEQRYRHNLFNEDEILSKLSDGLKYKLQLCSCSHLIEQVPLFHGFSRERIEETISRLKFELYLPNDVIIQASTVGSCMYFIEYGTVQIIGPKNGEVWNELYPGDFFGEMALLNDEHRRTANVIAKTACDIYRLDKVDFDRVIQDNVELYDNIVKVAKERQRDQKFASTSIVGLDSLDK